MTFAQLEAATARLGFTPSLDDGGELLRDAATRAIAEIALARPRIARATLWHYPSVPLYSEEGGEPEDTPRSIAATGGKSFYLRIVGQGRLIAERGGNRSEHVFSAPEGGAPAVLGGALPVGNGALSLRLEPSGVCRVLALGVYTGAYDGTPPEPGAPRAYDLAAYFSDFGAIVAPPALADGAALCEGEDGDYTVRDRTILEVRLPVPCRITLTYRRTLSLPATGELPLTSEEAALLPLYCAGYVFLDDDPEKAAFYLARFTEGLRRLAKDAQGGMRYRDVTGWG